MKATEKQVKKKKKTVEKKPIYYKFGRPTKYRPIFCKKIVDYFDIKPTFTEIKTKYFKGIPYEVEVEKPNPIPLFEMFAMEVCNVDRTTLHNWCEDYPDFFLAYKKAQSLQKNILLYQCAYGFITPSYAVFLTKAITDLNDVSAIDITSAGEKVGNVDLTSFIESLKNKDKDELQRDLQKQVDNKRKMRR